MARLGPVDAVLIPPQLERFRAVTEIGDVPLQADFGGWNKHVLLAPDRVFLFPRHPDNVDWFERELAVYEALEPAELAVVPRLLGRWHDPEVSYFPFAAVTRLFGRRPNDPEPFVAPLARLTARWHDLPASASLAAGEPPRHHRDPHQQWLHRALDPATSASAAVEAAARLDCPAAAPEWTDRLGAAAQLRPVVVHGDLHEHQLLVRRGRISGVLDWETARVDHPFWDFDFGQWGTGPWRQHRARLSELWTLAWRTYAETRGLDPDPRPLHTAFRIRQALRLLEAGGDPDVVGTIREPA
jgi:aminoglycoside phosphotransferase (APT) family kinase protein